jgi:hypothetical protein
MKIDFHSNENKSTVAIMRATAMFGCIFGIFFGVVSLYFVKKSLIPPLSSIPIGLLCGYFYRRFKLFFSIDGENVKLKWKNDIASIPMSEISSITKMVRFAFDDNFVWVLKRKGGKIGLLDIYFFPNEPKYDLIALFRDVGIPLKNMP